MQKRNNLGLIIFVFLALLSLISCTAKSSTTELPLILTYTPAQRFTPTALNLPTSTVVLLTITPTSKSQKSQLWLLR